MSAARLRPHRHRHDDAEVAEVLRRLAKARTRLVLAERLAGITVSTDVGDLIEAARVELLWATASAILAPEQDRSRRRLGEARRDLSTLLERHGYASYAEFAATRPEPTPDLDPELADARAEFEAVAADWERIQGRLLTDGTGVIDLTDR